MVILQRAILSRAHHGQGNGGAGLAPHDLYRFFEAHALDRRVVQSHHQVAGLDPRPRGGGVVDGRNDSNEPVLHADFYSEAAELSAGPGLQLRIVVRHEVGGVRIESRQHAFDGVLEKRLVVDGLDVVVLDLDEDLGKGSQILDGKGPAVLRREHPLPEVEQERQACSRPERHQDVEGPFHVHLPVRAQTETSSLGTKRFDLHGLLEERERGTRERSIQARDETLQAPPPTVPGPFHAGGR